MEDVIEPVRIKEAGNERVVGDAALHEGGAFWDVLEEPAGKVIQNNYPVA